MKKQLMVVFLVLGVWSFVGGGCVFGAALAADHALSEGVGEQVAADVRRANGNQAARQVNQAFGELQVVSDTSMKPVGFFILLGAFLCFAGAIAVYKEKAPLLWLAAPAAVLLGELAFFFMITFNIVGLAKVGVSVWAIWAALRLDQELHPEEA